MAGWLAFNAIGLGLIVLARRIPWFSATNRSGGSCLNRAETSAAHLVPLMVLVASMMLTGAVTVGL